jgi:hypothetical protein
MILDWKRDPYFPFWYADAGPFRLEVAQADIGNKWCATGPFKLESDFDTMQLAQEWAEGYMAEIVRQVARDLGLNIDERTNAQ